MRSQDPILSGPGGNPRKKKEDRDQRRRQAVEALEALLTKLRGLCQTLERLDQWYEILQKVRQASAPWEDALPKQARKRLASALTRAEQVRENLKLACNALHGDLQGVIEAVSPGHGFPLKAVVIAAVGIAVAGVGILAAVQVLKPRVTITVHNSCPDVLTYSAPGLGSPSGEIAPFSTHTVEVPAVEVTVQRSEQGFSVSALSLQFRFPVAPETMVQFDDILMPPGFEGSIDLGEQEAHEVDLNCR